LFQILALTEEQGKDVLVHHLPLLHDTLPLEVGRLDGDKGPEGDTVWVVGISPQGSEDEGKVGRYHKPPSYRHCYQ
jgi:hypothetical protein